MSLEEQFNYIFNPRSVAVVGASNTFGSWGNRIMNRLLTTSPQRKIYPVNNKESEVLGLPVYKSLAEIPDSVDFVVIAISAPQVPKVMQECVEKGVKAAIIISGGLAESGEEGERIEAEVIKIARRGGIRFIGPNTMGHMDTSSRFSTLAWLEEVKPGPVAFISQSGTYGQRVVRTGVQGGVGFSKFISSGNEADLHLEDYLEYLAQDEGTQIITAYIEGLREGRRFLELAKGITPKKPVIVMKTGGTKRAAKAAKSHTAALAGSEEIYDAMFRQSGVIRVEDEIELFDVTLALHSLPLPRGRRVGILTEGGGIGVVATEWCERVGLEVPLLSLATIQELRGFLPPRCAVANPVDMTDMITARKLVTFSCFETMIKDEKVDSLMVLGGVGAAQYFRELGVATASASQEIPLEWLQSLREEEIKGFDLIKRQVSYYQKPVVWVKLMPEAMAEPESFKLLRDRGIPVYPNPERAAKVLCHLARYREYLSSRG